MMLEVKIVNYEKLPEDLKEEYKWQKYNYFLLVYHNDELILHESDNMEPEDAIFYRDLNWVPEIIEKAYKLGIERGREMSKMEFFSVENNHETNN